METASSHLSARTTPWREREKVKSLSVLDLKRLRIPSVTKVKVEESNVFIEEPELEGNGSAVDCESLGECEEGLKDSRDQPKCERRSKSIRQSERL